MINSNRNRFRGRRVPEQLTDSPPDQPGYDLVDGPDERTELMAALMSLPAGQRAVVVLRYWMDLSEADTAAALGCSIGNVKSQAARALAKLRVAAEVMNGGLPC
jgi:RNA polymerase sigma factor (sigma-70 family)